eukprot:1247986-Amphidinium_carterae.1
MTNSRGATKFYIDEDLKDDWDVYEEEQNAFYPDDADAIRVEPRDARPETLTVENVESELPSLISLADIPVPQYVTKVPAVDTSKRTATAPAPSLTIEDAVENKHLAVGGRIDHGCSKTNLKWCRLL